MSRGAERLHAAIMPSMILAIENSTNFPNAHPVPGTRGRNRPVHMICVRPLVSSRRTSPTKSLEGGRGRLEDLLIYREEPSESVHAADGARTESVHCPLLYQF